MSNCEFYAVQTADTQTDKTNVRHQYSETIGQMTHCMHPSADFLSIQILSRMLGRSEILKCQGELGKCQITKEI